MLKKILNRISYIFSWKFFKAMIVQLWRWLVVQYDYVEERMYRNERIRYWWGWYEYITDWALVFMLLFVFGVILYMIVYTIWSKIMLLRISAGLSMIWKIIVMLILKPLGVALAVELVLLVFVLAHMLYERLDKRYKITPRVTKIYRKYCSIRDWIYHSPELLPHSIYTTGELITAVLLAPGIVYFLIFYFVGIWFVLMFPRYGLQLVFCWIHFPPSIWFAAGCNIERESDLNRGIWISKSLKYGPLSYDQNYINKFYQGQRNYVKFSIRYRFCKLLPCRILRKIYFFLFNYFIKFFFPHEKIYYRIPIEDFHPRLTILYPDFVRCKAGPFYYEKYVRGLRDTYFVRHRPHIEWFYNNHGVLCSDLTGNRILANGCVLWFLVMMSLGLGIDYGMACYNTYGISWVFPFDHRYDRPYGG